jgi:hypothetical protein
MAGSEMMKAIAIALLAMVATPAIADYVGPNRELEKDTPFVSTPWDQVVADYYAKGFDENSFVNQYGNKWNVWRSNASGNTLVWSKDRGLGYNCLADSRPNFWGKCTRYDLRTGQIYPRYVWLRIHDGGVLEDSD